MIGAAIIEDGRLSMEDFKNCDKNYCRVKDLSCLIEITRRIYRVAVDSNFIVKMRAGAIAREADRPDDLSFPHFTPGLDMDFFQVAVHGKKTMALADTY